MKKTNQLDFSVYDAFPGIVIWIDPNSKNCHFNHAWYTYTGNKFTEGNNENWLDTIHLDDLPFVESVCSEAYKKQHPFTFRLRLKKYDGIFYYFSILGSPVYDQNGIFEGYLGVFQPQYDQLSLPGELRQEDDIFYRLMEAAPISILQVNPSGKIIFVNPTAESVLGITSERIKQLNFNDPVWRASDLDGNPLTSGNYPVAHVLKTKKSTINIPFQILTSGGEKRILSVNATPIFDSQGEIESIVTIFEDITARMGAQQKLRESEEKYRSLFEKLRDGFALHEILCDENGKPVDYLFVEVNPAFEKFLGFNAAEVCGKTVREIFPQIESYWIETYGKVALTGEAARFENYTATLDKYFDILAYSPKPRMFATLAVDITERKRVEKIIAESEERYRIFLNNLQGIAYRSDFDNPFPVFFRGMVEGITGYRTIEFETGTIQWQDLILDEDNDRLKKTHPFPIPQGTVLDTEYRIRTQCGEVRWMHDITSGGWDDEKQTPFIQGVIYDITERKKIESDFILEHEKLVNILDAMTDGVYIIDSQYTIKFANLVIKREFGDALGLKCYKYLNNIDSPCPWCETETTFFGMPVSWEWMRPRSEKTYEVHAAPLRSQNTEMDVLVLFHDITEHRKLEKALQEERLNLAKKVEERTAELSLANAALMRAARLKDEILASMSHELRTPLTGILGLTEALRQHVYGDLNQKQDASLEGIEESGRHLLALINDILDLSKIEAGKDESMLSPVRVGEICQAGLRIIKQDAMKRNLKVSFDQDLNVSLIVADARRLKQILVNLLSNAVKFTPKGGAIGLSVHGDKDHKTVSFTIWDTGIGISEDNMKQLFQPFVQLDRRLAREYNGTGLGLALVQRMVDRQGGGVQVESMPGKGSRFIVTLPWMEVTHPSLTSSGNNLVVSALFHKVLIVEESEVVYEQLTRYITELGLTSIIHPESKGVVDKVVEERPDLILLEVMLADRSGWEVLRELKIDERTRYIPVIVVSIVDERIRALSLGALGYLVKPVSFTDLQSVMIEAGTRWKTGIQIQEPYSKIESEDKFPLILLVDDNEMTVEMLSDYFKAKQYRISVARNGYQALQVALEKRPNLIIMDVQMPGMDGLEAIRRIRAEKILKKTPILALTSLVMPGDQERCLAAGADEYLGKPVSLKHLSEMLEKYLTPG